MLNGALLNDSPHTDAPADSPRNPGLTAESNQSPWSWRRIVAASVVVALSYYGAAKLGAVFKFPSAPSVSALWAPNAILMAAFLVTPPRYWWAYLVALVPAHAVAQFSDTPLDRLVIQYFTNCALALLGAGTLLRLDRPPWRFDRLRSVANLILWAGLAAPLVTSLLMATAFILFNLPGPFWLTVVVRTLTNTFATLALVPLIVQIPRILRARRIRWRQPRMLETLVLATLLMVVGTLVFVVPLAPSIPAGALLYAPLPLLLWAAIRMGTTGVCWSVLALGGLSTWGVLHGAGPFMSHVAVNVALSLVCYLVVTLIALLLLAALLQERDAAGSARERISTLHRAVLASLEDQIAVLDCNGFVLELNESWRCNSRRVLGRMRELQPGDNYFDVCEAARGRDEFIDTLAVATGEVLAHEQSMRRIEFSRKDRDRVYWFEAHIEPLRRADGGAVLTLTDITARIQAEQEVRAQQHQLTHLTRAAMLGEFAGAVAHEINQPLAAILSNSEAGVALLNRQPPDLRGVRETLKDIISCDRRAMQVIQRLRLLFRQGEIWCESHDLNEIVCEALTLARSELMDHQVTVEAQFAADLSPVWCDRVQIQQVLLNLFRNACEAMASTPAAERRLIVTTMNGPEPAQVDLLVQDYGSGIPEDSLEHIFAPSFTTKQRGMGLGLAICRSILSAHGGSLRAENMAHGARLHVLLQRAQFGGGRTQATFTSN
jgi:signal transduction histidine kinase/integral membrane sensor domain MASE1